jgi:hypothetical protein
LGSNLKKRHLSRLIGKGMFGVVLSGCCAHSNYSGATLFRETSYHQNFSNVESIPISLLCHGM